MSEIQFTKEQLEKRIQQIKQQLGEVNKDERIKLDNDMEDQAIQMEQHEVSVKMEENLRKELTMIEDKLMEMDDD